MKKFTKCILFAGFIFSFLSGCTTLKQPKSVEAPLNYSDEDVKKAEIDRIRGFEQTEPVKALWRSMLLADETIIAECANLVEIKLYEAVENNDYFNAQKYHKSLTSINWGLKKDISEYFNTTKADIPGLSKNNEYAPKSLDNCMDSTVTIWVDRGWKVTNGAGVADIIIGSGFFIDKRGYIITNHHVIESMVDPKYEGFSRLYIKLISDSDTKIPAKVIGYDSSLDLALLKAEITPDCVFSLGSSSDLHIGDKVSAIGTPIGLEGTLTSGIISSTERKLLTLGNVFQIDAAVNSGNSGGPLIDTDLTVQAIVFAGMLQFQGLNFAIPVEYLRQILPMLYNNGEGGEVIHSWIGAYGHTKRNGTKKVGLEVQYVMPGGVASLSGLKESFVIKAIDGVTINSLEDYQLLMLSYQQETLLTCKYLDNNEEEKDCYIYLERRPEKPLVQFYSSDFITGSFIPIFGMKLVHSSSTNRNTYSVEKIIKGSSADQMSFSETDIVTVRDVRFDDENEYFYAQLYTQRKQKGFVDALVVLPASYDSPYYF